jgi:3-hydroxybutyryl-CoA dehydrogenase
MTLAIDTVLVLGAGQMGRGIAQVCAAVGLRVFLSDRERALAEQGKQRIAQALGRQVAGGKLEAQARTELLARIEPLGPLCAPLEVDFAIEAAPERLELKLELFRELDRHLPSRALLASNTSSISITQLAGATERAEQVIGMHFMNPVPLMQLVEVVRGLATCAATVHSTLELAARLNKTPVLSKDAPGFIVNRILIPLLNEACFALQEGLASAPEIDQAIRLGLNHPLGPLELADLIGLDTVLAIAQVLQRELGDDKYRPATELQVRVHAGWLGRKSGRGFYRYDERGKPVLADPGERVEA